jgi:predicted nucleic acid-binding protein
MQSAKKNQAVIDSWDDAKKQRLDNAILGISVISLAEVRSGYRARNWGADKTATAEATLAAYLWFPLDMDVVDRCAALRLASIKESWGVGDNDLWIAATAQSRDCAVVSCDKGFCRIKGIDLIYLPRNLDAPVECP